MAVNAAERHAMDRALHLAARGPRGANPQVGAVLLSPDGRVIAEGWHHGAGTPTQRSTRSRSSHPARREERRPS